LPCAAHSIDPLRGKDDASAVADDRKDAPASPVSEDPAIDSLEDRIAAARAAEDKRTGRDKQPEIDGRNRGMQIASTMVGYPLGGIVIGWFLDSLFDTRPWIMIGLMFLAFFGACLQVVRLNKAG
jgi:F0F1-type ATP synthase assembly protein I